MKYLSLKLFLVLSMSASLSTVGLPAFAEIVVIVNPKNAVTSMTAEQTSQYYLGISNSFVPVDQADGSPIRVEFYKKITNKEPGQVRAIWAKLVFTGKGRMPKEMASHEDVKKAVAADPNAIGYIDKSALDGSVKAVLTVP